MIIPNNLRDNGFVWVANSVMRCQVIIGLFNVSPRFNSLEEAEISQNYGWSSSDTRGAMDVNSMAFVVNHVVQVLGCSKYFHFVFFFIVLVHWEVDCSFNTLREIKLGKARPRISSICNIFLSLKIQDRCDSLIFQSHNIFLHYWIWTHENVWIVDLFNSKVL